MIAPDVIGSRLRMSDPLSPAFSVPPFFAAPALAACVAAVVGAAAVAPPLAVAALPTVAGAACVAPPVAVVAPGTIEAHDVVRVELDSLHIGPMDVVRGCVAPPRHRCGFRQQFHRLLVERLPLRLIGGGARLIEQIVPLRARMLRV